MAIDIDGAGVSDHGDDHICAGSGFGHRRGHLNALGRKIGRRTRSPVPHHERDAGPVRRACHCRSHGAQAEHGQLGWL